MIRALLTAAAAAVVAASAAACGAAPNPDVVPTASAEAFDAYTAALAHEKRQFSADDFRQAEAGFSRAVELDPAFALAWAGLARVHAGMVHFRYEPTAERRARSREAAETALRLQPQLGEAHHAMGMYWYWAEKDYDRAAAELEVASRSLPDEATVQAATAYVLRRRGDWEGSTAHLQRAIELDPQDARSHAALAENLTALGRFAEALPAYQRAHEFEPDAPHLIERAWALFRRDGQLDSLRQVLSALPAGYDPDGSVTRDRYDDALFRRDAAGALRVLAASAHRLRQEQREYTPFELLAARAHELAGDAAAARDRYEAARAVLETALVTQPDDPRVHASLGVAYAGLGRSSDAVREAERALELMPRERDALFSSAMAYHAAAVFARLGDHERALAVLEDAFSRPVFAYSRQHLRHDPAYDALRHLPRFQRLTAGT